MFGQQRNYNPFNTLDHVFPPPSVDTIAMQRYGQANDPLANVTPTTSCEAQVDHIIDTDPRLRGIRNDARFPVVYSMLQQNLCSGGKINPNAKINQVIDNTLHNPLVKVILAPTVTPPDYGDLLKITLPLAGGIIGYFVLKNQQYGPIISFAGGVGLSAFLLAENYNSFITFDITNLDWLDKLVTNATIGITVMITAGLVYRADPNYLLLGLIVIAVLGVVIYLAKKAIDYLTNAVPAAAKTISDAVTPNEAFRTATQANPAAFSWLWNQLFG